MSRHMLPWLIAVLLSASAFGQEQTILVNGPLGVLSLPADFVNLNDATLDLDKVPSLIDATLGPSARQAKDFYCVIHVLRWSDAGKVDKQNWYVYSGVETVSQDQFTGLRIFGSHDIALVYVHVNAQGAPFSEVARAKGSSKVLQDFYTSAGATRTEQKEPLLRFEIASQKVAVADRTKSRRDALTGVFDASINAVIAADGLDTKKLAELEEIYLDNVAAGALRLVRSGIEGDLTSLSAAADCGVSGAQTLVRAGRSNYCVMEPFNSTSYKVEVTKKLPSSISDLLSLAALHGVSWSQVKTESVTLWGGKMLRIVLVPPDVKVTPTVFSDGKSVALDSRTYDNEGRYYWDISAAIPVRSINDTTYDSTAGALTAKNVQKQNLYAVFNVFPFKVDTKGTSYRWFTPALLAGMGITGKPLDRLLVAGAVGLNKVQFFAGWSIMRKQFPGPASNPTAVTAAYRTNLIFGLNVPIRQILQTLKAAK